MSKCTWIVVGSKGKKNTWIIVIPLIHIKLIAITCCYQKLKQNYVLMCTLIFLHVASSYLGQRQSNLEKFVLCMIKRWKLVIASIVDRIERRPSSISKLDSPHILWKLKFIPHYINLEFPNFEVLLLDLGQGPFIDDIYASSHFARHGRNPLSIFFFF